MIVRRGRIVRVLRVATMDVTIRARYGDGSRSCGSGHGPFIYATIHNALTP